MAEEEKFYTSMYSRNAELYHHGVKGQKWGVENGPPYPLSDEVSTGKRLKKKVNKLENKSEHNRKIDKANEKFEKRSTKEDALKAEIKIKKLLAKENGGKYHYKDMTDEEKEYYKKATMKKVYNSLAITMAVAMATGIGIAGTDNSIKREIKANNNIRKLEKELDEAREEYGEQIRQGASMYSEEYQRAHDRWERAETRLQDANSNRLEEKMNHKINKKKR